MDDIGVAGGAKTASSLVSARITAPAPIHVPASHIDMVAQGGVDADEAFRADPHAASHHDMGCDEAAILDPGMVADMITAPQHDIAADFGERLQSVVFQDECILA